MNTAGIDKIQTVLSVLIPGAGRSNGMALTIADNLFCPGIP